MERKIPAGVAMVLQRIEQAGDEAYLVGGCVRDWYMGMVPHDYDITTSALPQKILGLFERVVETGMPHGTVTVLTPDGPVEVTTYRQDGEYSDHRHPDGVQFTRSLQEDLARRDFTMNAMAMDRTGAMVDRFGGRADIDAKIVRCVGEPDRRFEEDALRILRGLRFASRLGFALEKETAAAMVRKKELLKEIAAERVFAELCGLLAGQDAATILEAHREIVAVVLPELGKIAPLGALPLDPAMRMAALLCNAEDPARALARLKVPNAFGAEVQMLIRNRQTPRPADAQVLHRLVVELGADALQKLYAYRGWEKAELIAFLAQNPCLSVKELDVNGKDLMALGLKGSAIGEAQAYLLEQVIKGLPNQKEILINAIKKR